MAPSLIVKRRTKALLICIFALLWFMVALRVMAGDKNLTNQEFQLYSLQIGDYLKAFTVTVVPILATLLFAKQRRTA